ncbi:portal protein : Phage portal protein, lambda family OS=Isosphaera pallida (strain ATCC 43644 / DSM 9630 / IS1B) GN=Isop_2435 PE=4 SV=1: Phage_portal_2 [Gemmata massiliana]|uniref:Phage portal protein, lambda family n=1 Tax=Gemmata massiliana TaxID=1210884 RepID=A0A6P2CV16_9BACT|nr:phage portal protein [Gemmata massiliana]VTR92809.1 portal protein : Phage portal protein, lambda family OS=Isosphaera pallida (strain ATCC 43644 / DSM 9630 / IS1B) GN=Isop_2435 PE=4 SV=1: Phage_portal_2 [Gemmata massiliana]
MATLPRFVRRILDRVTGHRPVTLRDERGVTGRPAPVRGRYDAAGTSDENRNHWGAADGLSANAAHSPAVRQILRNRSRYEAQNNGYCKGLLRTRRNDVVGTGPRLQATLPGEFTYYDTDFGTLNAVVPEGTASAVERKWVEWCDRIGLADKLRVLVETGDRDGETFAVMVNNPGLPADGPQLDVRLYEADQVTTPDLWWNDPLAVDGIRFDAHGNPVEYHFLRAHPGDLIGKALAYDRVPASAVFHWYDPDRPNQARGIPATTPALPLYAQVRRYTLAALTSAEVGATISGVMSTKNILPEYQAPADPTGAAPQRPRFDRVEVERGGLLTLPEGWEATAFDAKQPVAGYGEFKREILTESGAALNAPRNISTKSSSEYNYSSARLDHIPYRAEVAIIRDRLRRVILDRLFRAWLKEAVLIPGYLPAKVPPAALWSLSWQWDGVPSIDPVKDATADDIGLKNGTKTLSDVLAERGKSWEEHLRQKAREIALARRLEKENGLTPGTLYPLTPSTGTAPQPVEEPADAEPTAAA